MNPPFPRPAVTGRACMFHVGRSGSTVLADQLGQHPGVRWGKELFDPKRHRLDPPGALDLLDRAVAAAGPRLFGFEVKFYHLAAAGLDAASLLAALDRRGFGRFVVLRRRNLLRKIVSSQVARRTGRWHLPAGQAPELRPLRIDPQAVAIDGGTAPLLAVLARYEAEFRALEPLLQDREVLELHYEDDIAPDPGRAYRRTTAFLGLPGHEAAVRLRPTTPWPLAAVVENFAELRAHLAGTPYAWMADE